MNEILYNRIINFDKKFKYKIILISKNKNLFYVDCQNSKYFLEVYKKKFDLEKFDGFLEKLEKKEVSLYKPVYRKKKYKLYKIEKKTTSSKFLNKDYEKINENLVKIYNAYEESFSGFFNKYANGINLKKPLSSFLSMVYNEVTYMISKNDTLNYVLAYQYLIKENFPNVNGEVHLFNLDLLNIMPLEVALAKLFMYITYNNKDKFYSNSTFNYFKRHIEKLEKKKYKINVELLYYSLLKEILIVYLIVLNEYYYHLIYHTYRNKEKLIEIFNYIVY